MKRSMVVVRACIYTGLLFGAAACGGGGGSDDSGVLVEGTLTEAGGAGHKSYLYRHSDGQKIGNVQVCALGECSTTDDAGQWGLVLPDEFTNGDVELSVVGHGIDATAVFTVPAGATAMYLALSHVEGGKIEVDVHDNSDGHHD